MSMVTVTPPDREGYFSLLTVLDSDRGLVERRGVKPLGRGFGGLAGESARPTKLETPRGFEPLAQRISPAVQFPVQGGCDRPGYATASRSSLGVPRWCPQSSAGCPTFYLSFATPSSIVSGRPYVLMPVFLNRPARAYRATAPTSVGRSVSLPVARTASASSFTCIGRPLFFSASMTIEPMEPERRPISTTVSDGDTLSAALISSVSGSTPLPASNDREVRRALRLAWMVGILCACFRSLSSSCSSSAIFSSSARIASFDLAAMPATPFASIIAISGMIRAVVRSVNLAPLCVFSRVLPEAQRCVTLLGPRFRRPLHLWASGLTSRPQ